MKKYKTDNPVLEEKDDLKIQIKEKYVYIWFLSLFASLYFKILHSQMLKYPTEKVEEDQYLVSQCMFDLM